VNGAVAARGPCAAAGEATGRRVTWSHQRRRLVPGVRRLAVLSNVGNVALEIGARSNRGKLGLEVVTSEIRRAEDIAPAFEVIQGRVNALYVCGDALTSTYQTCIDLHHRAPIRGEQPEHLGATLPELWRISRDRMGGHRMA